MPVEGQRFSYLTEAHSQDILIAEHFIDEETKANLAK